MLAGYGWHPDWPERYGKVRRPLDRIVDTAFQIQHPVKTSYCRAKVMRMEGLDPSTLGCHTLGVLNERNQFVMRPTLCQLSYTRL